MLFLAAGTILLGLTYVMVRGTQADPAGVQFSRSVSGDPAAPTAGEAGNDPPLPDDLTPEMRDVIIKNRAEVAGETLNTLLTSGGIALGVVALIGMGFGWLMAERALRPLARITETARRVAGRNLHERIALTGPRDEITELADTFDSMLERLDRAFDGQRLFVGNASHELRTPLAINRTLIEVALGRPDVTAGTRVLGETLLAVNGRQERLLDGLLTLAKSEQGLTVHEPVDLADVVTHVLDQTALGNLTLDRNLDAAVTTGDPVLLERVVQNLVQNAVAYNVEAGWVAVRTRRTGGRVELVVTNTGPPVPVYEVPSLFEPFRRLRDRVGSANGTGLGLSIVRSVAIAHRGRVTASPRDGGGLEIRVSLPGGVSHDMQPEKLTTGRS